MLLTRLGWFRFFNALGAPTGLTHPSAFIFYLLRCLRRTAVFGGPKFRRLYLSSCHPHVIYADSDFFYLSFICACSAHAAFRLQPTTPTAPIFILHLYLQVVIWLDSVAIFKLHSQDCWIKLNCKTGRFYKAIWLVIKSSNFVVVFFKWGIICAKRCQDFDSQFVMSL